MLKFCSVLTRPVSFLLHISGSVVCVGEGWSLSQISLSTRLIPEVYPGQGTNKTVHTRASGPSINLPCLFLGSWRKSGICHYKVTVLTMGRINNLTKSHLCLWTVVERQEKRNLHRHKENVQTDSDQNQDLLAIYCKTQWSWFWYFEE